MKKINLTAAEWSVMECLWRNGALTGREATEQLAQTCGWSRSTTLTLLARMEAKGAVCSSQQDGKKTYRAQLARDDAALQETEDFLERVFQGSVSMMVSAMTRKQTLPQAEIDELYALLKELEEK